MMTYKQENMQKLDAEYRKNGMTYTQIWRDNVHAIYRVDLKKNVAVSTEVWRIKIGQAKTLFGRDYPEREVPPNNEDFGVCAWACNDMEHAWRVVERDRDLLENTKERSDQ